MLPYIDAESGYGGFYFYRIEVFCKCHVFDRVNDKELVHIHAYYYVIAFH